MSREREVLKKALTGTASCLELPLLLDHLERDDFTTKAHLAGCPRCAAEAALYEHVTKGPMLPDTESIRALSQRVTNPIRKRPQDSSLSKSWWNWLMRPLVYAPVLGMFAGLVVAVVETRMQHSPTPISYENVERSQSIEMLTPKGELGEAPENLQWSAVPGAMSYRVRMLEVDRNVLWESTVKTVGVSLPTNVRKKALPGKRLIWTVEAYSDKGEVLGNGMQDFRRAITQKHAN